METLKSHLDDIIHLTDYLLHETAPPLTDEQRNFTQVIQNNVKQFAEMITPILDALPAHQDGDPFPGDMHALRTPLVSIIGYADVFVAGVLGDILPEQEASFRAIVDHGLSLRDHLETIYATIKTQLSDNPLIV